MDGGWGEWNTWNTCSVTCGNGNQTRTRECNSPPPQNGGDNCSDDGSKDVNTKACVLNHCPGNHQSYLQGVSGLRVNSFEIHHSMYSSISFDS